MHLDQRGVIPEAVAHVARGVMRSRFAVPMQDQAAMWAPTLREAGRFMLSPLRLSRIGFRHLEVHVGGRWQEQVKLYESSGPLNETSW